MVRPTSAILHRYLKACPPRQLSLRAFAHDRVVPFDVIFADKGMTDDLAFCQPCRKGGSLSRTVHLKGPCCGEFLDVVRLRHIWGNDRIDTGSVCESLEAGERREIIFEKCLAVGPVLDTLSPDVEIRSSPHARDVPFFYFFKGHLKRRFNERKNQ